MDRLSGLVAFAEVVAAQSFSAAAKRLGVSKAAISKHVSRLEERLGARLLQRTTRRLALTEIGVAFHERCLRILAEAEEAERAVQSLGMAVRGTLKVTVGVSFGVAHVAPLVPEFQARHPDLRLEMQFNDRVVDLIEEGFDVAVRIAQMPDSSLVARRLAPVQRVVCASPDYLARHGTPAVPDDLRRHNCLIYTYLASQDAWRFVGPARETYVVRVDGNYAVTNGEAQRHAALAGQGIILSPNFIVAPDLRAGRLVALLPGYETPPTAVHAVYPASRHPAVKLRAFVDFLAAKFTPTPPWERP
jgi:DNA-binding transcriptional LysR family regulator